MTNNIDIKSKEIVIFDLDQTLTESKSDLDSEMADLLGKLLKVKKVVVISGGSFNQFLNQFLSKLSHISNLTNLTILPTSGTRMYVWNGTWTEKYAENFTQKEKDIIFEAFNSAFKKTNYKEPSQVFGQVLEDRGSQITFSGLGQKAPLELKSKWDPDRTLREPIVQSLKNDLPLFDLRFGGISSIDVTKKGVNKGFGIRKLEKYTGISIENMVFIGDALYYGGNDYAAKATGIDCIAVNGPQDVKEIIKEWLKIYSIQV
jgi:HAD superfamily hydrolase (TIGR01484 family)